MKLVSTVLQHLKRQAKVFLPKSPKDLHQKYFCTKNYCQGIFDWSKYFGTKSNNVEKNESLHDQTITTTKTLHSQFNPSLIYQKIGQRAQHYDPEVMGWTFAGCWTYFC